MLDACVWGMQPNRLDKILTFWSISGILKVANGQLSFFQVQLVQHFV